MARLTPAQFQQFKLTGLLPLPPIPAGAAASLDYKTLTPAEFAARKAGTRIYYLSGRTRLIPGQPAVNGFPYDTGYWFENLASTMADSYNDMNQLNAAAVSRYNASNNANPLGLPDVATVAMLGALAIGGAVMSGYATMGSASSGLAYGGATVPSMAASTATTATTAAAGNVSFTDLISQPLSNSAWGNAPADLFMGGAKTDLAMSLSAPATTLLDIAASVPTQPSASTGGMLGGVDVNAAMTTAKGVAGAAMTAAGVLGGTAKKPAAAPSPAPQSPAPASGNILLMLAAAAGIFFLI